ncbi:MAG: helix-turn-helix domain-containing protein [Treponema sp.]|jgi:transcriptional regulator with XRE-family HTH domain|nr:helix-turn-helix domain-containing protein [Treponema sp.]
MSCLTGNEINRLLGKNLKRLRNQKKISQLTLADMANLTHNFINDIENGRKWVSSGTLAKLSKALKIEPYQLFDPQTVAPGADTELMTSYLDDMEDSFAKMVNELRARYLTNENT